MSTFVVTHPHRYYSDVILQADTVKFETKSKLILGPIQITEKPIDPDAPRTLTIIARSIEITDVATITYDLDGDGNIDADTPQPPELSTAPGGSPGHSYNPGDPDYVGAYPHATDGGNGMPGQRGKNGTNGKDAPIMEIWVRDISAGSMTINFKGQGGGKGGNGGTGGPGGGGQKGATAKSEDAWYNGEECVQEPGQGGDGGRGGDAGEPGVGGNGGNGGNVKIFTTPGISLTRANSWLPTTFVDGGKGGDPGNPGSEGNGGAGGPQGDTVGPCPSRPEFHGSLGPDGRTMDKIDPNWRDNFKGKNGNKGEKEVREISLAPT